MNTVDRKECKHPNVIIHLFKPAGVSLMILSRLAAFQSQHAAALHKTICKCCLYADIVPEMFIRLFKTVV